MNVTPLAPLAGNGILGNLLAGSIRIPAFMAAATAAAMIAELSLRLISGTFALIGIQAAYGQDSKGKDIDPNLIGNVAKFIKDKGMRPYQNMSTTTLVKSTVAMGIIAVLSCEFARIVGGPTPPIYNNVLAVFGPIRIDSSSYLTGVQNSLRAWGVLS